MNTAKIYHDVEGNERTINQMVKCEPDWAANRIQAGEDAIELMKAKDEALTILALKLNMTGEALEELVDMCKLPLSERFAKMGLTKAVQNREIHNH